MKNCKILEYTIFRNKKMKNLKNKKLKNEKLKINIFKNGLIFFKTMGYFDKQWGVF